jgi:hypothetical protein
LVFIKNYSLDQINRYILHKQSLLEESKSTNLLKITENLIGLQATGAKEPYLYLFVRSEHFTKDLLDRELFFNRSLAKIRGMRNTLFIVPREIIVPISQATKSLRDKRFEGFFKYTDWEQEEYQELEMKIIKLVEKSELSASEIKKKLGYKKSLSLIISLMCDKLLLIRGKPVKSWKDNRSRYTPFQKYFPKLNFHEMTETEAIKDIIYKYIESYGPVTQNDMYWWIGLSKIKVKKGMEKLKEQLVKVKIEGLDLEYFMLDSQLKDQNNFRDGYKTNVNLLPFLDPYLMSYKDRERFINPQDYEYAFDRSGNATSSIILDGKVIGIWDYEEETLPMMKVHLFNPVKKEIINQIKKNAYSMGEFLLEKETNFEIIDEMTPLTKRKAGRFMHPLS